jgi:glyoxylase-like metal-dependent hydrolase (beta-lactamase superfamily II)
MDQPTSFDAHRVAPETFILPAYMPLPGIGVLPINAFLIRAQQPLLIDTGLSALRDHFVEQVAESIDLQDLRWIWLTHTDPDHIGALAPLLERAPNAKVVTTFLGMGKMGLHQPLPPDRVFLLNPGQVLDLGDRAVSAHSPPTFDAPETTMAFDHATGALFSSDCLGAAMQAPAERAGDIDPEQLRQGAITWATVDSPWLHLLDPDKFRAKLATVRDLDPSTILSAHLPPATDLTERLLGNLDAARTAPPFVGPDHEALMQMMAVA